MTEEEKIICKQFLNDADKTHSCNEYKLLMALLEQEPRKITIEDVEAYCTPRCLTIVSNSLLYELTHPKTKAQEPRWIPVEENTPPLGTICLWCNKQGRVFTSEITYRSEYFSYVGKHGYFSNGLENHGDIVAWMPLPKAYREVENE